MAVPNSGKRFETDGEVRAVVRGFEDCMLPPDSFDHGAHLAVALYYLHACGLSVPETTERMRFGLLRYLDHNGVDRAKYNETITVFWVKCVRGMLEKSGAGRRLADIANELNLAYGGNSKLVFDYYSKERLNTEEARTSRVEPDLKPPDF